MFGTTNMDEIRKAWQGVGLIPTDAELEARRIQAQIDDDEMIIDSFLIGRISDLPLYVQGYIKSLREQLYRSSAAPSGDGSDSGETTP